MLPGIAKKKNGSRFGSRAAKWKIGSIVKKIDGFGQEIPSFNIKGETRVNTVFGGIITVAILTLTLAYAILKGIDLVTRKNPTINDYVIPSYFHDLEYVNLDEIGFKVAFSFRNYSSLELIDDSRYVKWIVRKYGLQNGTDYEELVPYHKCTDADYAGFYPVAKNSESPLKAIREDPKKNLLCLDDYKDFLIGGDSMSDE